MTAEYAVNTLNIYKSALDNVYGASLSVDEKKSVRSALRNGMLDFFHKLNDELYGSNHYIDEYCSSFRVMDNVLDELDDMLTELELNI